MNKDKLPEFPVLQGPSYTLESVPWDFVAPHERQAKLNHRQSLKQLAERGGLSPRELLAVVSDMDFDDLGDQLDRDCAKIIEAQLLKLRLVQSKTDSPKVRVTLRRSEAMFEVGFIKEDQPNELVVGEFDKVWFKHNYVYAGEELHDDEPLATYNGINGWVYNDELWSDLVIESATNGN